MISWGIANQGFCLKPCCIVSIRTWIDASRAFPWDSESRILPQAILFGFSEGRCCNFLYGEDVLGISKPRVLSQASPIVRVWVDAPREDLQFKDFASSNADWFAEGF